MTATRVALPEFIAEIPDDSPDLEGRTAFRTAEQPFQHDDIESIMAQVRTFALSDKSVEIAAPRERGTLLLLRYLASMPGDTWQARWEQSPLAVGDGL